MLGIVPAAALAATDPPPDCVVTSLTPGASLRVAGQVKLVTTEGMRIKNCRDVAFENPSVKVRYVAVGDSPYATDYKSLETDRGHAVTERIHLEQSFRWWFRWRGRPTPAITYAGVISAEPWAGGAVYVIAPRDPSDFWSRMVNPSALDPTKEGGKIELASLDSPSVQLTNVKDLCQFNIFLSDCSKTGSTQLADRQVEAFLATPYGTTFHLDAAYNVLGTPADAGKLRSVPPDFMKKYLASISQAPSTPSDPLDEIFAKYAFSMAVDDRAAAAAARKQLKSDYPMLFEDIPSHDAAAKKAVKKKAEPKPE